MRFFKASLRTIIMLASTFSFLGGWVLLAHALKPSQSTSPASAFSGLSSSVIALTPLPTLAPLPGMTVQQAQAAQPVQNPFTIVSQPQVVQQPMPVFTTSGS